MDSRFPLPGSTRFAHMRSWDVGSGAELMPERHEQMLRRHPEKYSEMVHSVTSCGIYLIDRAGIISSWNRGAELIAGYARADVLGKHFEVLFPDDSVRDGLPRRTLEFVRANRHSKDEQRRRRRSSGEFLAQSALDSLRAESGELLGFVEVFQDITEAKQREERLYERATRDPLTGVFNRGHFVEAAALEMERARRFSEPLSLLLIDIDRFTKVNDTYGHDVGDRVIVALTRTLSAEVRKVDVIGRVGGEEFAVLLPRANKEPAAEIGQRLRRVMGQQRVAVGGGREIGFTISLGLASLRPGTRDLAELMRNADAALYRAKREGRNRLESWFE